MTCKGLNEKVCLQCHSEQTFYSSMFLTSRWLNETPFSISVTKTTKQMEILEWRVLSSNKVISVFCWYKGWLQASKMSILAFFFDSINLLNPSLLALYVYQPKKKPCMSGYFFTTKVIEIIFGLNTCDILNFTTKNSFIPQFSNLIGITLLISRHLCPFLQLTVRKVCSSYQND